MALYFKINRDNELIKRADGVEIRGFKQFVMKIQFDQNWRRKVSCQVNQKSIL